MIRQRGLRWLLGLAFGATAVLLFGVPLLVALLWSLVDPAQGWFPPALLPPSLSLANWRAMLVVPEMANALLTSFTIAPLVTVLCLGLALPTAYALARPVRWRRLIDLVVLAPLLLPGVVLATGLAEAFMRVGLSQTLTGVVLVQAIVLLPLSIRILTATFEPLPRDLIEAARNLGAGPLPLTRHVLVPSVLPGVFAATLLTFVGSLEEFLLTFVVGMPKVQTMPILLWNYIGGRSSVWTYGAVVTLVLLVPTLLLMVLTERLLKQEHLAAGFGKG